MRTPTRLLVAALALTGLALAAPGFSDATFTTQTRSTGQVRAAYDWTPPTVNVLAPAGPLSATATVTATAADSRSAVASVTLQQAPASGSPWTTLCVDTTSPYACPWTTTAVADGDYLLRATAVDVHGNTATSATVPASVANTPTLTLADPGDVVRGTVPLKATISNPGQLAISGFRLETGLADSGTWTAISGCASTTTSLSCSWTPATGSYDLRAVATIGGTVYTDEAPGLTVDNAPPTVTLTNPGSPLSGTVSLGATADDVDSGVATVDVEYAPAGTSTWKTACSDSTAPYSCRFATTTLADGSYDLRATATDYAGNVASSATRRVSINNTIASVSVESPGTYVSGTVALVANANSTNGVAKVSLQRATSGSSSFTEICADTTSPYGCDWATTGVGNGSYDLRAVLTDVKNNVVTSGLVTVQVDNSALRALDVQAVNKGAVVGKIEAGDQLVLTYSGVVAPGSLVTGWDGTDRSVTVRVKDALAGGTGGSDTLSVDNVNLGEVVLNGDYVKKRKTVTYASTVRATTSTVGTVTSTVVTLTLGTPSMTGNTTPAAGAMVWTPSALAKNLSNQACSTTPATESGASDKDF